MVSRKGSREKNMEWSGDTKVEEILIFAGTTEGRELSETLAGAGIAHTICVATEYGETALKPHPLAKVHRGRMNREEIAGFLQRGHFAAVVDATHPFAKEVTANLKAALGEGDQTGAGIPYLRLEREHDAPVEGSISYFTSNEACAKALEETEGNILLTTGSKELPAYCASKGLKDRLYVRVLPSVESISLCEGQGIYGKRILAMQGPFSAELNEAVLRQYGISCMVTKESGRSGGYPEKLEAAKKAGVQVFVIGCPKERGGYSFVGLCRKLEEICQKKIPVKSSHPAAPGTGGGYKETDSSHPVAPGTGGGNLDIVLAGIGMGSESCLTKEAEQAIREADILLGAGRLLENLCTEAETRPYYQAGQIIPYLQGIQEKSMPMEHKKAVILFSGDSGCYSGCQSLYQALGTEIKEGRLKADVRILPGISSVSYLASCIGESYQDAAIYSIHGKTLPNLARRIQTSPKTFLLTSGVQDVNRLGSMLLEAGLADCEVTTGYRMSYGGQRVEKHTPLECCGLQEEGLYTCFIHNPNARKRKLTHGMADGEFIRDKVPMTKEEVREVSICKLRLTEGAVVYDIGSGTGSIAVEAAALSDSIQVYAIERKKAASSLMEQNKEKHGLQNIIAVEGEAPEALAGLPAATHTFIGGSGGRLKEILEALRQINPKMRVVINAISMETVSELKEILDMEGIKDQEAIQLQVNRVTKTGNYHLVRSENPVFLCSFQFCGR